MITTVDGVTKKPGESVWGISYNHDHLYESIEIIVEHDMHKSLSKCLYFADRNLCSEQVGLMNQGELSVEIKYQKPTNESYDGGKFNLFLNDELGQWQNPDGTCGPNNFSMNQDNKI